MASWEKDTCQGVGRRQVLDSSDLTHDRQTRRHSFSSSFRAPSGSDSFSQHPLPPPLSLSKRGVPKDAMAESSSDVEASNGNGSSLSPSGQFLSLDQSLRFLLAAFLLVVSGLVRFCLDLNARLWWVPELFFYSLVLFGWDRNLEISGCFVGFLLVCFHGLVRLGCF